MIQTSVLVACMSDFQNAQTTHINWAKVNSDAWPGASLNIVAIGRMKSITLKLKSSGNCTHTKEHNKKAVTVNNALFVPRKINIPIIAQVNISNWFSFCSLFVVLLSSSFVILSFPTSSSLPLSRIFPRCISCSH